MNGRTDGLFGYVCERLNGFVFVFVFGSTPLYYIKKGGGGSLWNLSIYYQEQVRISPNYRIGTNVHTYFSSVRVGVELLFAVAVRVENCIVLLCCGKSFFARWRRGVAGGYQLRESAKLELELEVKLKLNSLLRCDCLGQVFGVVFEWLRFFGAELQLSGGGGGRRACGVDCGLIRSGLGYSWNPESCRWLWLWLYHKRREGVWDILFIFIMGV